MGAPLFRANIALLVAVAAGAVGISACSQNADESQKTTVSSASPVESVPVGAPPVEETALPTPKVTLPTVTASVDPQAPVPKAIREGKQAKPSVVAKPESIGTAVNYADGVSIVITSSESAIEESKGPGTFPGRRYVILNLRLTNSSSKAVPLDGVVLTVLDKTNHPVNAVYAEAAKAKDFGGVLEPGAAADARYAFAVPVISRDKVTVAVDFDSTHSSAVFTGELPS